MTKKLNRATLVAGIATVATASAMTTVLAGGFDRGGVNVDQLFDTERFSFKTELRHVMPQRKLKNVRRGENAAVPALVQGGVAQVLANPTPQIAAGLAANREATIRAVTAQVTAAVLANPAFAPDFDEEIDVDNDFTVPAVGIKMGLTEDLDCLLTYTEPYGADADYGLNNAYSASAVEFSVDTKDLGATCGYKFDMGETSLGASNLRVIAGVSYQQLDAFQSRQRFLDLANSGLGFPGAPLSANVGGVTNSLGLATFEASDDAFGYRVGVAYEIPAIALRAMVLYQSKYDYDVEGVQDNSGVGGIVPGVFDVREVPITASTEMPQAIEIRLQSGINDKTLGYLNMKWQQWSKLGIIPIAGGFSPVDGQPTELSFDPEYQDGYTISGGIGRRFTDEVSGLLGLGWDRGTSTVTGSQTDTYTLSAGLSYTPTENFTLNFGGLVGVLTDGDSQISPFGDSANNVTYEFDNDPIYALSASVKLSF